MDKFNFAEVKQRLTATRRELLVLLSRQAQNYFVSSFKKQAWNGEKWKNVQRRIKGTPEYKYPKTKGLKRRTNPILIGSGYSSGNKATTRGGTLRRAVSTMARTAEMQSNGFRMIVDLDYAKYLNEGTDKMVARTFVGQTDELTQMQSKTINKVITRIWQA